MRSFAPNFSASRALRLVLMLAIAALVGTSLAVAGGTSRAFADGGTASVSGTVTGGGAPLEFAYVAIQSPDGEYYDSSETDSDGTYSFSDIPAGQYTVDFQPAEGANFLERWWQDAPNQNSATYFSLADGQSLTSIDADLPVGATISGTVDGADAAGVGLADVYVDAESQDGSSSGSATTDSDGNYTIIGLSAGSYTVQFQPNEGNYLGQWWTNEPTPQDADLVDVGSAATVSDIDAHLAVGATISGTVDVAGSPNTPLADATVTALDSRGLQVESATTDDSGDYTISALPAGTYSVQFQAADGQDYGVQYWQDADSAADATPVTLTEAESLTDIDAVLPVGASIAGVVYAPGTPRVGLAHVQVTVYAASDGAYVGRATSNKTGHYKVKALAPGTYTVSYFAPGAALEWWGGSFIQTGAQTLTLTTGQALTGIRQHLVAGSSVSGTVTGAGDPATPDAYVDVTLWRSDQVATSSALPPLETRTDDSGNYSFAHVGPGTYTILFGSEDPDFRNQWWRNKPTQAQATPLVVRLNTPRTGVDATLAAAVLVPGTPRITGRARVGQTLTVKTGVWKPSIVVFTYQWLRNGVVIPKATGTTYVPTAADLGSELTVAVTGTIPIADAQGKTDTEVTAPTAPVKAAVD